MFVKIRKKAQRDKEYSLRFQSIFKRYLNLRSGCRSSRDALGEAAFAAGSGIFVDDAFGGSAVNNACGCCKLTRFESFFDGVFYPCLDDLVGHFALAVLAQTLFG